MHFIWNDTLWLNFSHLCLLKRERVILVVFTSYDDTKAILYHKITSLLPLILYLQKYFLHLFDTIDVFTLWLRNLCISSLQPLLGATDVKHVLRRTIHFLSSLSFFMCFLTLSRMMHRLFLLKWNTKPWIWKY